MIRLLHTESTTMPPTDSTSAVLIETDEPHRLPIEETESCPDASMIQMAHELLALSGKGQLPTMTHFQPLHRPRSFTPPNYRAVAAVQKKKRHCLAAISDDEDDIHGTKRARREMTQLPSKPRCTDGGVPSSSLPLGRPLAAPPRLPCLAPGQSVLLPPGMLLTKSMKE